MCVCVCVCLCVCVCVCVCVRVCVCMYYTPTYISQPATYHHEDDTINFLDDDDDDSSEDIDGDGQTRTDGGTASKGTYVEVWCVSKKM